jgi:hypothetical protein
VRKGNLKNREADFPDPEQVVEDEAFMNDMYETYKNIGMKPEQLRLKKHQDAYRAWLAKHQPKVYLKWSEH